VVGKDRAEVEIAVDDDLQRDQRQKDRGIGAEKLL
jgi:hypothetical protein